MQVTTKPRPPLDQPAPGLARQLAGDLSIFIGLALGAKALLLAPLPPEIRLVGAWLLFVLLPGFLFVQTVFSGLSLSTLERWLLAVGCGFVLAALLTLLLYSLFRPLSATHLLLGADLLILALLLSAVRRRADLAIPVSWPGWQVLVILAVAAPLRLIDLDYSHFHGDESKVVLRTMAVLQGVPDALIAHRRPPGEILINASLVGGIGVLTEQTVRLPFALAGLLGVLGTYALGRALFGAGAGLVAALLLAVTGYFVAFGRILQYPSMCLLLDVLAVLCLYRFSRGGRGEHSYAVAGALLVASSALVAFSGIFLLPVAAVAAWPRLFGPHRAPWSALAAWLWPLAILLPTVALFYLLLPAGANGGLGLEDTFSPYLDYRFGGDRPYFNLVPFIQSVSHYNSSLYALVVLGAGLLVVLEPLWRQLLAYHEAAASPRLRQSPALAWAALDLGHLSVALIFGATVLLLLGAVRRSLSWKLALVWFASPLFVHLFLVRLVGTHWREALPGLALLLGAAVSGWYTRLASPRIRLAVLSLGVLFLLANAHYAYVVWVQPWPEYQTAYPRVRHPLDWTGLNSWRGGSTLGATRDYGYKAIYVLMAEGQLPSEYDIGDRAEAAWYLKNTRVCLEQAPLYIRLPESNRAREAVEKRETRSGFYFAGRILVEGRPTTALLLRQPPPGGPKDYRAEDYGWIYDRDYSSPWAPIGDRYRPLVNEEARCAG